jgi:hypothetical protein
MYKNTIGGSVSQTIIDALLAALGARPAGALLAGTNVHLFVAGHSYDPVNDNLATYTAIEAAFTGYTPAALTLVGPVNNPGQGRIWRGSTSFLMTGTAGGTPQAFGIFVSDTANTLLYWARLFDQPVSFQLAGDFLDVDSGFALDFLQN